MSWETLAYTDAGIELLMDAVSGKQLTITQAVGGSGLANAAVLHAQTDVTGERHALELLGIKSVEENGSAARRVNSHYRRGGYLHPASDCPLRAADRGGRRYAPAPRAG